MEELLSGLQAELQDANEHNEVDIYKVLTKTEGETKYDTTTEENRDPTSGYFTVEYDTKRKESQALYDTMSNLNKTHFDTVKAEAEEEQTEDLIRYTKTLILLVERVGEIEVPAEFSGQTDETDDMRKIIFIKNKAEVGIALDTSIEALEQLDRIELKKNYPQTPQRNWCTSYLHYADMAT